MSRKTSSSSCHSKYLPRRPRRSTRRPSTAAASSAGASGIAPARVEDLQRGDAAPLDEGREMAADRLDLGQLGHPPEYRNRLMPISWPRGRLSPMSKRLIAGVAALTLAVTAEADAKVADRLPRGGERVTLDPADFTTRIDNPYWPMAPGSRWVYRETDAAGHRQRIVVTVTSPDEADRRHHRPRRPRRRDRRRARRRGHLRLVRAGPRRKRLVPGRGHEGVRARQGRLHRGVMGGRRRRRAGRA